MIWSGIMARKSKHKLVTLDDECFDIIQMAPTRMQSVFVRNAIRHYYRWMEAGHTVPMIKDGTLVNRFDANEINMRMIELQDRLEAQTKRWNDAYVENISLKKQLSEHQEKENPSKKKLKKWWHFFYVGFRK